MTNALNRKLLLLQPQRLNILQHRGRGVEVHSTLQINSTLGLQIWEMGAHIALTVG